MTVQAQNALLKVLEEPPMGVYIFLLCENISSLLSTVRSRAPSLRLASFSHDDLEEYLLSNSRKAVLLREKDPAAFEFALKIADGSVGAALSAIEARASSDEIELAGAILESLANSDRPTLIEKFNAAASDREGFVAVLDALSHALRDIATLKSCGTKSKLLFFSDPEYAEELSLKFAMKSICNAFDYIDTAKSAILRNANLQATAIECTCVLWNAAHC